jgi:nitroreductase
MPALLSRDTASELVHVATMAPSGHNTQPWRFAIQGNVISLYPDLSRHLPAADPDDHELYISLGCALENLILAARARGLHPEVRIFEPATADAITVALFPGEEKDPAAVKLAAAIFERHSARLPFDDTPIPPDVRATLFEASHETGVRGLLFTEKARIEKLIEFTRRACAIQVAEPAFRDELLSWVRFTRREVAQQQDGLTYAAMGLPRMPRWLGSAILRRAVNPKRTASSAESLMRHSAAVMLFLAQRHDREHWVRLGMAFERVALTATANGLKHSHLNMACEVPRIRAEMAQWLECGEETPLLLIRLGYGSAPPHSPRRPLKEVLM